MKIHLEILYISAFPFFSCVLCVSTNKIIYVFVSEVMSLLVVVLL